MGGSTKSIGAPVAHRPEAPGSTEPDALKIFISYSRRDTAIADQMVVALEAARFAVMIDRRDLPYGEKWQQELSDFIRASDTVIWLVSPASIASRWCNWELGEVQRLNKRLVPVVAALVKPDDLPGSLGQIHLLPAEGVFDFKQHLATLIEVLESDRAWLKEHTRLADRARQWLARSSAPALLLRGVGLKDAQAWVDRKPPRAPAPWPEILQLLMASRRAEARRQRFVVAMSLAAAIVGIGLAGLAWWQRNLALEQEQIALEQRNEALIGQSLFLTDFARQQNARGDHGTAMALEALPDATRGIERPYVHQAEHALYSATHALREQKPALRHDGPVRSAVFSPDGKRILTASDDSTARLWDADTGDQLLVLAHEQQVFSAVFSPDGKRVLTASREGKVSLWHSVTGAVIREFNAATTSRALFSPGGEFIASAGFDGLVHLWSAVTFEKLVTLGGNEGSILSLDFSANGQRLVTASVNGAARLWDTQSGETIAFLSSPSTLVTAASIAPDGSRIATGEIDWPHPPL
jgi:hypothetical protein